MVINRTPTLPTQAPEPKKPGVLGEIKDSLLDGVDQVADFMDSNPVTKATVYQGLALSRVLHAFPKFIYPTITGATPAERSISSGLRPIRAHQASST